MKTKIVRLALVCAVAVLLPGCIAFPPLVQVEHKDSPNNHQEIMRRLDAIDHRLDQIEQRTAQK